MLLNIYHNMFNGICIDCPLQIDSSMAVLIPVLCPDCHSSNVSKYGKSPQGKQRYLCQNSDCLRRTFILDVEQPGRKREVKQKIVDMALNGSGVRDTARVLGVSTNTVIRELKKVAAPSSSQSQIARRSESARD